MLLPHNFFKWKQQTTKGIHIMWKKIISFFFRPAPETVSAPVRKTRKVRKIRKVIYYQPQLPLE